MKKIVLLCGFVLAGVSLALFSRPTEQSQSSAPQFTTEGKLVRPTGYRKWVFVSSGYGMSYSQSPSGTQMFTNVFVTPAAYDYFAANGKWPDKTMFVLEVKDKSRFADKWAYFNFSETAKTASADTPSKNECWKCHEQNAAVEHSFVQFYPELLKIAHAKGTIKPGVGLD